MTLRPRPGAGFHALRRRHGDFIEEKGRIQEPDGLPDSGFDSGRPIKERTPSNPGGDGTKGQHLDPGTKEADTLAVAKKDAYGAGETLKDPKMGEILMKRRLNNAPKVGEQAPDFELERMDGKGKVKLSDFRDKKPVVLVFGSFT